MSTFIGAIHDDIAERIRQLGEYAPNNYVEMSKNASIAPATQTPDAEGMLEILVGDNKAIIETLNEALKIASDEGDEATLDLMVQRIQAHDKAAWMLESSKSN